MRLTPSIRRRLVAILIGVFLLAWLSAFAATYAAATYRIGALFDAQLSHDAGVLLVLAEEGSQSMRRAYPRQVPASPPGVRKLLAFSVWHGDRLVLRSFNAPPVALPDQDGYSDVTFDQRAWRAYVLQNPQHRLTIWVGQPVAVRNHLIGEATSDLLLPMLLALPLLVVVVGWGVGRGLVPLERVASDVAERSPSNLQPVDAAQVPVEIGVLVERLNGLLFRLREAFDRERRFTADAAHEIRTPLAGIRTHAQLARRATEDAQRQASLDQVIEGVDRTTRLVEQLLSLARLDRQSLAGECVVVDLGQLAAGVLADLNPEADTKHIALSLQVEVHHNIRGHPMALAIMLRNLIDNAIRYTPPGGAAEVSVTSQDQGVALTVTDNGPGVPVAERTRVFERFYRAAGTTAFGCGLGLSIAQRVADLHDARIDLGEGPEGRGLRVTIRFPKPA